MSDGPGDKNPNDPREFLGRFRSAARRAEQDPEQFRREVAQGVQRVREGVEKLSAAGDAVLNGDPALRRGMENYFLRLLGRAAGQAIDQRTAAPPSPTPPSRRSKRTPRSRQRARPRDPGIVEDFMKSVFYGNRR